MYHIVVVLLMTIGCICSADLPRDAQREMDSFTIGLAKADADRQAKVNALVDKAVKALNDAAKKADTAEARRAIDDEILGLKKLRKNDDLLGDGKTDERFGRFVQTDGRAWGEINPDGTAKHLMGGWSGKWSIDKGKLIIAWLGTSYVDTLEPSDQNGLVKGTNDRGETWTMKKETKK